MKRAPQRRPFPKRASGGLARVLLAEFVHSTARIHDLLLARKEWVAVRADFDLQVVSESGTGHKRVPAAAGHGRIFVLGVNRGFHGVGRQSAPLKRARSVTTRARHCKAQMFGRQCRGAEGGPYLRLSTNPVDKCVDDRSSQTMKKLQGSDIVKLVIFSPGHFYL